MCLYMCLCVHLCAIMCLFECLFVCIGLSDREQGLGLPSDRVGVEVKKVSKIHFFSSGTEAEEGRPVRYFSWL